ncbi:GTPase ObgE [Odoribacter sp. OttesenSCG-928-L07]|nr:GTPase ObgE [Odoribacter sp. OttesenSCG-928-L07]MDL2239697.1 GTPase ObgE [Bacteroidales bacterium OttesenSCG-928-L14]MDL2240812.1 GTPase ObgE [Bacteroidales bacterium OttesenSCG-928-K22]
MSQSNFVDYVKIFCKSGDGGGGSMHFHRSKKNPRGGPDGGNGGSGGNIIIKADAHKWTLLHLKYTKHVHAENGGSGSSNLKTGKTGDNVYLYVPLGTVAKDAETGEVIGEVVNDGDELILKHGGRGGMGNDHFKSATFQAPKFAQPGEEGQEGWVILELKILADVGLVGFPNAGKSTLLSVMSAAKPEIADYPFTTLVPNLGMVQYRGENSFVIADIPGIIEGAHLGKGLGHRFLRHIERNAALLFMVPVDAKSISKEYQILLKELKKYNPELLDKPRLLAITKCDIADDEILKSAKKTLPKNIDNIFISSVTLYNIDELKDKLWKILND